ncbi:MAG: CocE/NonD family hydrolase [Nitrospirales bacterium]
MHSHNWISRARHSGCTLILLTYACISSGVFTPALAQTDAAQTIPRPYHGQPSSNKAEYTKHSHYLTMQDGVKIAITVYKPGHTSKDKHPTILHQTRYWRSIEYRWPLSVFKEELPRGLMGIYATRFLNNGYVWVDVDVRGSGASFGSRPYAYAPQEIHDGGEIVDWIIQQPWSNGKVGALGISYAGAAAEMLLANQHPAVKAVAPLFSGFDLYPEIAFPGGIHLTWFTKTWTYINNQLDQNQLPFRGWMAKAFVHGMSPVDADTDRSLLMSALSEHQSNWSPHEEALHLTFRDDIPDSKAIPNIDHLSSQHYSEEIAASGAAIYNYSGWLDGGYQLAAIKRHLFHNNPNNKLIIGPWDHGGKGNISPFRLRPSEFDHQGELLKFFDYYLQDLETGIKNEARIHYFTMGEEQWKASNIWPPEATNSSYYFDSEHQLTTIQPQTEDMAKDQYIVDTTIGTGHQSRWNTLIGQTLPTPYADRPQHNNQLQSYTSAPLEQAMEVTGHPIVTMYLSATTTDATVFAYLEDINEEGTVTYVTEGLLRALHRKTVNAPKHFPQGIPYRTFTRNHAAALIPGKVTELSFDLLPTSYQFKQGHRIRLSIAGADKDHFAILPGEKPIFTIHRSKRYPSQLTLPIVD